MQLSQMKTGQTGRIVKINSAKNFYRQRLISLGLLPGTEFSVIRIAPLGDPVEISVRGFALILRKNEANILDIEQVSA